MSTSELGAKQHPLDRIEAAQGRSLERLQADTPDRALLVQLLEASCLLELAKLDATRLDAATYLQLAVDVLAQMYPVNGVSATISYGSSRGFDVVSGRRPHGGTRYPLVARQQTIGTLVVGTVSADLGSPDHFFVRAASQLALGVMTAIDSERLRRDAASATAARVASKLTQEEIVDGLEELALAVASFPSVIAAELVIDHAAIGPPLHLRAGYWDDDEEPHSIGSFVLDLPAGQLVARLRSTGEELHDDGAVRDVLQGLAASLDRLEQTQRLVEDAETDLLSGLGNRRRMERSIAHALGRAHRYGERVAIMLIDLDKFKAVNDILGHDVGDEVIVQCASALQERLRAYDDAIRLGGDEFVVVAPVADLLDARGLAEDLRETIGERCASVLPPDWGLSATLGVALFPDSGQTQEELLRAADEALYRAKGAGRDAVAMAETDVNLT
jgi:diguanylate cyclase (GGDEF)-like protein